MLLLILFFSSHSGRFQILYQLVKDLKVNVDSTEAFVLRIEDACWMECFRIWLNDFLLCRREQNFLLRLHYTSLQARVKLDNEFILFLNLKVEYHIGHFFRKDLCYFVNGPCVRC